MEKVNFEGWENSIRLANGTVELVATTAVGPRVVHLSAPGGPNLLGLDAELLGKVAEGDEWVNYGGHRLWHAPEITPRTYAGDNNPVAVSEVAGAVVLTQPIEPTNQIEKVTTLEIAPTTPVVKVGHTIINRGVWTIDVSPWALTVTAGGGRVILPHEPFAGHGEGDNYLPARPVVFWPFTDMSDSRYTWGKNFIQLRSDKALDSAQKLGLFSSEGWGAFAASNGDLLVIFIEPDNDGPDAYTDFGSNFETFTKGDFQELETLGPIATLDPNASATHYERWVIVKGANLPADDAGLGRVLPGVIADARKLADAAFPV
ncbi:MAG TPA: hypothetical protein VGK19_21890 [Capsulimonadaceae bacterium]|jgi:hypothetical protein